MIVGYDGDIVGIKLLNLGWFGDRPDFPGFTREATGEIINLFGPANPKWVCPMQDALENDRTWIGGLPYN